MYAETWRRSILNLGGQKRWSDWAAQVRPAQLLYLTRVLLRTQRLMRPSAYLAEYSVDQRQAPKMDGEAAFKPEAPRGPEL